MLKIRLFVLVALFSYQAFALESAEPQELTFNTLAPAEFKTFELSDDSTFDPGKLIVIDFNILKYSPLSLVPSKTTKIDDFIIQSSVPIIVFDLFETTDDIKFEVTGFSDKNIPETVQSSDLKVVYKDREVPFNLVPFSASGKTAIFDLILDESGSMQGDRIGRLIKVVEAFMRQVDGQGHLCRITWFSHSYHVMGDYQECGLSNFGNIVPSGHSGGTSILEPLVNSFKDLRKYDSSQYSTNILVVGDGYDSSVSNSSLDWTKTKGSTSTFVYIIDDNSNHGYDQVADYVLFKETEFDKNLFNYMLAMQTHTTSSNTVVVERSELLTVEEKRVKEETAKKKAELEAEKKRKEEEVKKNIEEEARKKIVEAKEAKKLLRLRQIRVDSFYSVFVDKISERRVEINNEIAKLPDGVKKDELIYEITSTLDQLESDTRYNLNAVVKSNPAQSQIEFYAETRNAFSLIFKELQTIVSKSMDAIENYGVNL